MGPQKSKGHYLNSRTKHVFSFYIITIVMSLVKRKISGVTRAMDLQLGSHRKCDIVLYGRHQGILSPGTGGPPSGII